MKSRFIFVASMFIFFLNNFGFSQLDYKVSSCAESGIRPIDDIEGIDILGDFFQPGNPDEKGCWIHHHPNGTDFVVTPKNWQKMPNSTRAKQIHEAMEAIIIAREAYGVYGSLSSNLYYILDDTRRSHLGEAFWIVNKNCWMLSGVPGVSGLSARDRLQVYTHEIGHCLIMENMNNYDANYALNGWFDESVAEYFSSQSDLDNNYEHRWARKFMFSKPFRQPYLAYPLWKYYVDRKGKKMLFPMMQSLADASSLNSRRSIMRSTGFDAILHNFYFDFFRGKLKDETGGIIPADKSTLNIETLNLKPGVNKLIIDDLPMDKLNGYNLVIPAGYDLDINPLESPTDGVHQSLMQGEDYHVRNWISKKTVKGDCEDDVSFLVLASHLNNKSLTNLYFDYALREKEKDECCDETIAGDCNEECLAPLDVLSEMDANPVEEIDGVFKFDYKIKAVVRFEMDMSDVNIEYSRGIPNELIMEYYVNSADGSILFPSGPTGFFNTNFRGNFSKVDASIWLANGQMITYGYDARNNQKRAVARKITQTANERTGADYLNMMQFFSSSAELAEHPDPMPEHIKWDNIAQGYKGRLIEGRTGIENVWTLYFDTKPTPIKTSCIMMGYMVGVLKDAREQNCNRLVVYNKVNIGGEDSKEAIEAELQSIKPMGITFDGSDYKPMFLGGDIGTDINSKMKGFEARMLLLQTEKEELKKRRNRCSLKLCLDRIDAQLEQIETDIQLLNCEIAKTMGMEDMMDDCN